MATFLIRGKTAPNTTTPVRPPLVNHDVNEYSLWQHSPGDRNVIIASLTRQKVFAAGGQTPTKFWRYDYDVKSDATLWTWAAPPSWPIRLLTNTVLHGKGGQVQQKFWRYDVNVDATAAPWKWQPPYNVPLAASYIALGALGERNVQLYESASWQWQRQAINLSLYAKPFFSGAWNYDLNDASGWQWQPPRNRILDATFGAPFVSEAWHYDLNVEQYWQWQAPYNVSLASSYISLGPLNERNVQPLDEAFWQWLVPANLQLFAPTAAQNPFKSGQWLDLLSEPSLWTWQKLSITLKAPQFFGALGQAPTKLWRWDHDQSAFWTGQPVASLPIAQLGRAPTAPTKQWHYDYDDAAFWLGTASSSGLSLLNSLVITNPFFSKAWHTNDIDEPGSWQWYWQNIQNILSTSVTPPEPTPSPIQSIGGGVWRQGIHPSRRAKKRKRKHDQLELAEIAEAIAECLPLLPAQEAKKYEGIVSLARLAPVNVEAALEEAKAALAAIERRIAAEEEDEMVAMLLLGL